MERWTPSSAEEITSFSVDDKASINILELWKDLLGCQPAWTAHPNPANKTLIKSSDPLNNASDFSDLLYRFVQSKHITATNEINLTQPSLIDELISKIDILINQFNNSQKTNPSVLSYKIYNLPLSNYILKIPIDIILEVYSDETIAIFPDLEIYGEGRNPIEAINELKYELIDLFDDLNEMEENDLHSTPQTWKITINNIIEKKHDN